MIPLLSLILSAVTLLILVLLVIYAVNEERIRAWFRGVRR